MSKKDTARIRITQIRSVINRPSNQKRTIKALGLQRMHHSVIHNTTPQILGMVNKVRHLVNVEEVK
jgi:large subunit ribosomal protein L30